MIETISGKVTEDCSARARPFPSDVAYAEAELGWLKARAFRLNAERLLERCEAEETDEDCLRSARWQRDELPSVATLRRRQQRFSEQERVLRTEIDQRLSKNREMGHAMRLDTLCELHGLDGFERIVLLMALAPVFSLEYEDLFASLDPNELSHTLSVEVAFAFNEIPFSERIARRSCFTGQSPLIANDLVTLDMGGRYTGPKDLLNASVGITSRTFSYLVGSEELRDEFMEFSSVEEPMATFDRLVLAPGDREKILSVVDHHEEYLAYRKAWGFDNIIQYGRAAIMLFHGLPGTGKTMATHAIADHVGKRILNVDIPAFMQHADANKFLPGLFREARLQNAILFFDECEALFASRSSGNVLMTILLTELERFDGMAILATNLPETLDEALDRRIMLKLRFSPPDRTARLDIWRKHLPKEAPIDASVDVEVLADRYELSGGLIKNAVLMAVGNAVHECPDEPILKMQHLEAAARAQLVRPRDDQSAMSVPRVRLDDVILPDRLGEEVKEIVSAARNRRTVLERWKIGSHLDYGKGISAMFYGEPGTGKTLCAEAIAGELSRPLLVASIPALLSKWVGETESNVQSLFHQAKAAGAVLFLDEADSLLMARGRGGGTGRHDDSVVNTLLKLIEKHDGLVLLATNRARVMDSALERRLTYKLKFPFPKREARLAIWKGLLPSSVPVSDDIDFERLASLYRLSGGLIKNAVFKAAFRAASEDRNLNQDDLESAAAAELCKVPGANSDKPMGFAMA